MDGLRPVLARSAALGGSGDGPEPPDRGGLHPELGHCFISRPRSTVTLRSPSLSVTGGREGSASSPVTGFFATPQVGRVIIV